MGTQTSSPGDLMVLILDACHISVLDGLLCRVCFFLWHPSLLISQSMKLCQSISYLSYQVIVWITFLHLSVVSLCQLVKSPGRSVFQVYLISLLLIVIEISISSARCCLFLFFFHYMILSVFCSFLSWWQKWHRLSCEWCCSVNTEISCRPLTAAHRPQLKSCRSELFMPHCSALVFRYSIFAWLQFGIEVLLPPWLRLWPLCNVQISKGIDVRFC